MVGVVTPLMALITWICASWIADLEHPPTVCDDLGTQVCDGKAECLERREQTRRVVEGWPNENVEIAGEARRAVEGISAATTTNSTPWTVKNPINSSKSGASSIYLPPQVLDGCDAFRRRTCEPVAQRGPRLLLLGQ